jgi:hypothetical protein
MSRRVVEDAKTPTARLVFGERGAEAEDVLLGLGQILDSEVEVDSARCSWVGPWGWPAVGNALEVETGVVVAGEHDEVVVGGAKLSAEELLVEPGELARFGTVDGDCEQAGGGHLGSSSCTARWFWQRSARHTEASLVSSIGTDDQVAEPSLINS